MSTTPRLTNDALDERTRAVAEVIQPDRARGPLPGLAILTHPQRAEIDRLLFQERINPFRATTVLREQFGLRISRRSITNYIAYWQTTGYAQVMAVRGAVVIDEVERDARQSYAVLKKLLIRAEKLIDNEAVRMRAEDIINLLKVHFDLLGGPDALRLVTAEQKYEAGLAAVMEAIQAEADAGTKARIQHRLMADERFLAAVRAHAPDATVDAEALQAAMDAAGEGGEDDDDDA